MRVIIEALGRRIIDLKLIVPLKQAEAIPGDPSPPAYDTRSTTAAHINMADDGVHRPLGFVPVIKAWGHPDER